jgi:hypothetical protein
VACRGGEGSAGPKISAASQMGVNGASAPVYKSHKALILLEATPGIEPGYADLQSD